MRPPSNLKVIIDNYKVIICDPNIAQNGGMQIKKKKFTDESFVTADPDVILNLPNMTDATLESVSAVKVINCLFSFLC